MAIFSREELERMQRRERIRRWKNRMEQRTEGIMDWLILFFIWFIAIPSAVGLFGLAVWVLICLLRR